MARFRRGDTWDGCDTFFDDEEMWAVKEIFAPFVDRIIRARLRALGAIH